MCPPPNLHQIFKKRGLIGSQFSEGVAFKVGGGRFQGVQFLHKTFKLKSEIFNDKKSLKTKKFFSLITKNLNWEILTKQWSK